MGFQGTQHGGDLSPLLWFLVLNGILKDLKHNGKKVVADDEVLRRGLIPLYSCKNSIVKVYGLKSHIIKCILD